MPGACAPCARFCGSRAASLVGVLSLLTLAGGGLLLSYPGRDAVVQLIYAGVRAYSVLDSASAGAYPGWMDNRDPTAGHVTAKFYLYNLTNVEAFLAGAKPQVAEVGPLTYKYINTKHNVTWENDATEVTFSEYRRMIAA